jgi:FtsP/CotA-like multicopper oxidase with cupredoxin domain
MKHCNALLLAMAAIALGAPAARAAQGTPLPGDQIAQFVDPLPVLSAAGGPMETVVAGGSEITLNMLEFKANMMPTGFVPATGTYTGTWTFGYRVGPTGAPAAAVGTQVGPVIVATRGQPTQIRYVNNLTTNGIAWRDWIDKSLHSAFHQVYGMPMPTSGDSSAYLGPVPAVPHLHGGEDPAVTDGGPEAYFLSDQGDFTGVVNRTGPAYYTYPAASASFNEAVYRYPNTQPAAPLWFHDHLLGGTRLNATFAGLAGAYAVIDPGLVLPAGLLTVGLDVNGSGGLLPDAPNEFLVPLVIQDRMFDTEGQLYFPNVGVSPEHPIWVPEFVGDTIIVNGKVWPFLNVDRQRYRFYLIDGSNSRPYEMFIQDATSKVLGPPIWVIATDGGYLDKPVLLDPNQKGTAGRLFMMPGERYEIIVDFGDPAWLAAISAAYPGGVPNPLNLLLRNTAPTVDGPSPGSTTGRVMQFRVSATAPTDHSFNPATPGATILTGAQKIVRLPGTPGGPAIAPGQNVQKTRELTLNEIASSTGEPGEVLVNNSKWNGLRPDGTPIPFSTLVNDNHVTELPGEGDTEIWEIVNTTADAHPIHLHGVQFQIVSRQKYSGSKFNAAYAAAFGGTFQPASGPPLPYSPTNPGYNSTLQAGKYGGNPDVTPFLQGAAATPAAYEQGWKDTVVMPSGEVTRVAVRFGPQKFALGTQACFPFNPSAPINPGATPEVPGYYVWHCHITDHEDNEMMRPSEFVPSSSCPHTDFVQVRDY